MTVEVSIREARRDDVELIYGWIVELAEYERAREHVTGTPTQLKDALFGARPSAEAVIAEVTPAGNPPRAGARPREPAGYALFHGTFSTWECRPGIWLEDLYVPPAHRRSGIGGVLIAHVARITLARGCARLEWNVLDWNTPALDFYAKLGARQLDDWKLCRLDGGALARVAAGRKSDN